MNDRQLERALNRRSILVPESNDAVARAMAALDLDPEVDSAPMSEVKRNPWTIPVIALPILLSSAVVFMLQKEAAMELGARAIAGMPRLLQISATSWHQAFTGLAPGILFSVGATVLVGCAFASWSLADTSARSIKTSG